MTGESVFVCPDCGRTTRHAPDIEARYCPACSWWTGDPELGPNRPGGRRRPDCWDLCAAELREGAADLGVEVEIRMLPPEMPDPFVTGFTCPHALNYFMWPTAGQRLEWQVRGVR